MPKYKDFAKGAEGFFQRLDFAIERGILKPEQPDQELHTDEDLTKKLQDHHREVLEKAMVNVLETSPQAATLLNEIVREYTGGSYNGAFHGLNIADILDEDAKDRHSEIAEALATIAKEEPSLPHSVVGDADNTQERLAQAMGALLRKTEDKNQRNVLQKDLAQFISAISLNGDEHVDIPFSGLPFGTLQCRDDFAVAMVAAINGSFAGMMDSKTTDDSVYMQTAENAGLRFAQEFTNNFQDTGAQIMPGDLVVDPYILQTAAGLTLDKNGLDMVDIQDVLDLYYLRNDGLRRGEHKPLIFKDNEGANFVAALTKDNMFRILPIDLEAIKAVPRKTVQDRWGRDREILDHAALTGTDAGYDFIVNHYGENNSEGGAVRVLNVMNALDQGHSIGFYSMRDHYTGEKVTGHINQDLEKYRMGDYNAQSIAVRNKVFEDALLNALVDAGIQSASDPDRSMLRPDLEKILRPKPHEIQKAQRDNIDITTAAYKREALLKGLEPDSEAYRQAGVYLDVYFAVQGGPASQQKIDPSNPYVLQLENKFYAITTTGDRHLTTHVVPLNEAVDAYGKWLGKDKGSTSREMNRKVFHAEEHAKALNALEQSTGDALNPKALMQALLNSQDVHRTRLMTADEWQQLGKDYSPQPTEAMSRRQTLEPAG